MARVQILYWQEIPSLVEARGGGKTHKEQLSQRFQELIDLVAMKRKLAGTDGYLEQWNKGEATERDGEPKDAALAVAQELEARFDEIRREALAASAG
ncbi:MAG: virulence factor [Pseudomonadota bacterium]